VRTVLRVATCLAALGAPVLATSAHANSAAIEYFRGRAQRSAVPSLLTQDERAYYKDLFTAIKAKDWARTQLLLAQKPAGPLHAVARAEYYLAAGSPRTELDALSQWLAEGRDLPQAEQIASLAQKRGATTYPNLPSAQPLASLPSTPKRIRPRDTNDGTMPASIAAQIQNKIKFDDPAGAKVLLDGIDGTLSPEARAEWRTKIAWSFYIENDDASAYAVSQTAAEGAGPWVAEGWWGAGLAAWRLGDFAAAGDAFARAASGATNSELQSAALYWQSRALIRARQPEKAIAPLRAASARDETLYGMLALEQLGMKVPESHGAPDFTQADWQRLRDTGNIRNVVALAEIGEDGLADEILRHQARIGGASQYQPLSRLARDLGLPSTQLWMAYNVPAGGAPAPAARYPTPKWTPVNGWKVDPALVYAHTLQESVFRAGAVSPAGAKGLMQIMPAAAKDNSYAVGVAGTASDLSKPEINLAFGQQHLQLLRDSGATGGLLPKVIAAYNAGPAPVMRWNTEVRDGGDPLLWIESLPYWETRGYVNIVMRNYWMYERQAGGPSESRMALVQGMWPTFPGLSGGQAVRLAANGVVLRGR
jgi:soluble lytic murein transglycosylase-like protein